jgi:hypothetical protein
MCKGEVSVHKYVIAKPQRYMGKWMCNFTTVRRSEVFTTPDIGTVQKKEVLFMPKPKYLEYMIPCYPLDRRLDGPQCGSESCEIEKFLILGDLTSSIKLIV